MAPPPPELNADTVAEILLLVPPDEPAHLIRASAVCKPWHRILTDPAFLRRYREFHGTLPLLGFIYNYSSMMGGDRTPRFVPTTAASPFPQPWHGCRGSLVLDCRHGRVLLHMGAASRDLIVWDPLTGERRGPRKPGSPSGAFAAAVLCATAGCNHLDCHGGPFLVVVVGGQYSTLARVYSSETGAWSAPTTITNGELASVEPKRGALVGNAIYFTLTTGLILKYDFGNNRSSWINKPHTPGVAILMPMEDSLGVASIRHSSLHLWLMKNVDANGNARWGRCRVIGLETMLPSGSPFTRADVIGFAEGVSTIFVRTDVGVFTIDLKSRSMRKICEHVNCFRIIPFLSFYTPDRASSRLALPAEAN